MRRRASLVMGVVALAVMLVAPSLAFGLINEYGMSFTGQEKCLECHDGAKGATVHGRFAKQGLVPAAPAGWTVFKAAGDPAVVAGAFPIDFTSGGTYSIAGETWATLGDYDGGAATEYLYFQGSADPKVNPWNLVEGLIAEPGGEWLVGSEAPTTGLYDVVYGCQRCHMLGTTKPTASATSTQAVPNPQVSIVASFTTGLTWARPEANTVADFGTDPAVSYPGFGIACEACHGSGFKALPTTTKHWNSGTQLSHRMPASLQGDAGAATLSTLGNSQVCGQCHGSYVDLPSTLGIYGYTPNLNMRSFVNINGLDKSGYSYTYTPTEAEFLANPTKYYLFPNGSNAKGNHYYYNEWSTSAHAYRGAYFNATSGHSEDPDALEGGKAGHYNAKTSGLDCARCHTGEGYLKSKDADITKNFTPTNANTGFMGQECVVCHEPHPAGVGMESNIREPDPAGVRSNAGLTTANSSMCEDCHNWQYEVQGTTPVVKPLAALSSRGGASHPQREMLHGKVMLEIPVADEFMPGAECQECHMPKTNKNENRFSHGMHIMEPGKAELWQAAAGYTKGQDSCSPCHPGETRAELQANLDDWKDAVALASTAASEAIVAAQTGGYSEYSLTLTTAPGYILVGKATWNWKAVQNDGSAGAHNPFYAIEGLDKAVQMADSVGGSFELVDCTDSIASGGLAFVAGQILNGDGSGAADADLELLSGSTVVASTKSDANGNFAFTVAPTATTTYTVRWKRSSDPLTWLTSSAQTITVTGGTPPGGDVQVFRFYRPSTRTHFYTASQTERDDIIARLAASYSYDGVAYVLHTAAPSMDDPLWRFYNPRLGVHFYTLNQSEGTAAGFTLEGEAYKVSATPAGGATVYRFRNPNGTHFYTLNTSEGYAAGFAYEGEAFYLAP